MALRVIQIAKEAGKEHNLTKIHKVTIRKGEFSGILEEAFVFAFDSLKANGPEVLLKAAEVKFTNVETVAECMTCGERFSLERQKKLCPYCKGHMLSYPFAYDFFVESIEGE